MECEHDREKSKKIEAQQNIINKVDIRKFVEENEKIPFFVCMCILSNVAEEMSINVMSINRSFFCVCRAKDERDEEEDITI